MRSFRYRSRFKALDHRLYEVYEKDIEYSEKLFNHPKLGWENYNITADFTVIPAQGNHLTMMLDPKKSITTWETKCGFNF